MTTTQGERTNRALNRLAKWRVIFAGWQLGTRAKGDPECDAVRDHREVTLLARAELSAMINLLVAKGLVTIDEVNAAIEGEANALSHAMEAKFPGAKATAVGVSIDVERALATWMKGWKP